MTDARDVSDGIRIDWACVVQNIYQRAIGDFHQGHPTSISAAVDRLARDLPPAVNTTESVHLRRSTVVFLNRAALMVHLRFHSSFSPERCDAVPPFLNEALWMEVGSAMPLLLHAWVETYTDWFDRQHELPPAVRAMRLIEERFAEPMTMAELARAAGCGRTTLSEQFAARFGLSPSEYLARVRIRKGIAHLRASTDSVDEVARSAGYQSGNKFYARVRRLTGLTPSQIRGLDEPECERVIENAMPLRTPAKAASGQVI